MNKFAYYKLLAAFFITTLILISAPSVWSVDQGRASLRWDPSVSSNVAGYKVHFGTASGVYASHINVGLKTSYGVEGLKNLTTYYFTVTAYNSSQKESVYSNEVSFTVPAAPTVRKVSATSGLAGMEITIEGDNLTPGTAVQFNGVTASIVSMSSTAIVVTIPSGARSGPLTISTAGGVATATNFTIIIPLSQTDLLVPKRGAATSDTIGLENNLKTGYALASAAGGVIPYGTAVYSYRQNGAIVSEVGVPAAATTHAARFFVDRQPNAATDDGGTISTYTGFAIVNMGTSKANLNLLLRDSEGKKIGEGTIPSLDPGCQTANFIDRLAPDFILPENFSSSGFGSLEITSEQLISVMALRLTINQRGELSITSTPIADLSAVASSQPQFFPQLAFGGGYQTSLILLNTSTSPESGTIQFRDNAGSSLSVGLKGESEMISQVSYGIAAGGVFRITTDETQPEAKTGWIEVIPDSGQLAPVGAGVFALTQGGVIVAQSGVPATLPTTRALIYVDNANGHDTGLAIVNPGDTALQIAVKAFQSDGITAVATIKDKINVDHANGQGSSFAYEIIGNSAVGFKGVLELTSTSAFAALTLRALTNERGEFLFTLFPTAEATHIPSEPIIFPQIAYGEGYKTEFIFLNPSTSASNVSLEFHDTKGKPMAIGK
jgi:hypothetical protein